MPSSLESEFKDCLVSETQGLAVGNPIDYTTFVGPVIHSASYDKLRDVIDAASKDSELELCCGGIYDDSRGYFLYPTVYRRSNPNHELLSRELCGPILVVYVYDDKKHDDPQGAFAEACKLVDETLQYGLTCAIFASDRNVVRFAEDRLVNTAGNFYINCKSTGAVVGQ
ncbi:ALDH-like protein [Tolypocladium paradoxum]|uniref:ALDH-like protein n=1 Tax=Tolypocladium paradoxum TaxID=94208 RepID=A0A2S4KY56_9HYPO|nr:ALDH-like protein [Tolypocladium paradoxum]